MANDFNQWIEKGHIPDEVSAGTITLLFKKGDPSLITNYRPISLLNSIAKVLTRVITNRLSPIAQRIVSTSQNALPGRYIGYNIRSLIDSIEWCKVKNLPLGILLLDQEKAFDKVSHEYLFATLQKLGFNNPFINTLKTIYSNGYSRVKFNDSLSEPISLERGVRQGDPLSPLLFVFAMEPLIAAIEKNVSGVPLPDGSSLKSSAFADDRTVYASTPNDISITEHWMQVFEKATGATFNKGKCEAILFKIPPPNNNNYFTKVTTDQSYSFTYLGVPVSLSPSQEAWNPTLQKFKASLLKWSHLPLTLTAKITVIKHYALPIVLYPATFLTIPKHLVETITKEIKKFLWNGKKAKVLMETCMLPRDQGGLGLPDVKSFLQSLKAKWISLFLKDSTNSPWKSLASSAIQGSNADYGHGLSSIFCGPCAPKSYSSFWNEALLAFWATNPTLHLPDNPTSASIVRCIPLFNNSMVRLNDKPLSGAKWKRLAAHGIVRLADIIFDNRIGTLQEISNFFRIKLRETTYQTLVQALPPDLIQLIQKHPWTISPNSLWGHHEDGRFHSANTSNPESIPESLRPLLRPFTLSGNTPEFLDTRELPSKILIGNRDAASLKTSEIRQRLLRLKPSATPKSQSYWDSLQASPSNWKSAYRFLWKAPVPSKYKDLAWLITRNSLFTGDVARRCNSQAIPHNCLCGHPETLQHIFLDCEAAKRIWNMVSDKWQLITLLPSPSANLKTLASGGSDLPPQTLKWHKSLWQILSMTALFVIWTGRCHNVYGDTPSDYVGKFIVNMRRVKKLASKVVPTLRGLQHL